MKIIFIECNEEELKTNRGFMDSVVDAVRGITNSFWGNFNPVVSDVDEEESEEESEEKV